MKRVKFFMSIVMVMVLLHVLNIPQDIIPLNVIPIGHPTGTDKSKDKYKLENIHREKW